LITIPLLYAGYGIATLHMPTTGAVFGSLAAALNLQPTAQNGFYDSAGRLTGGYADIGHLTSEADSEAGWRIVELVRQTDAPVLSEDAAFSLLAGKQVIANPTQLLNLANDGHFDPTGLVAMIDSREFGLIILRARFYPVDVLKAIDRAYTESEIIRMNGFDYAILRPKAA
jgi:hypothetical protein